MIKEGDFARGIVRIFYFNFGGHKVSTFLGLQEHLAWGFMMHGRVKT